MEQEELFILSEEKLNDIRQMENYKNHLKENIVGLQQLKIRLNIL